MSTTRLPDEDWGHRKVFNTRWLSKDKKSGRPAQLLSWANQGRLLQIRRGIYAVPSPGRPVNPLWISTVLTRPYFLSFHTALSVRGIGEAVGRRIYIQSPRRFTALDYQGTEFVWVRAPRLFGAESIEIEGVEIKITDMERTLLDGLRYPAYMGGLDEFLRSLEGVQRYDLLTEILEANRKGAPAGWKELRARFEDRRAELDALQRAGLILRSNNDAYLTLFGLAYCPDPRAEEWLKKARRLYADLRAHYKSKLEAMVPLGELEPAIDGDRDLVRMLLRALSGAGVPLGYHSPGSAPQEAVIVYEGILDYVDLDQLLAARLQEHRPPPEISLTKKGLPYIRFDRLMSHLKEFGEKHLYAKAGLLATVMSATWKPPLDFLREARRHVASRKTYFPASLPRGTGRLVSEWNLIVPRSLFSRYEAVQGKSAGIHGPV